MRKLGDGMYIHKDHLIVKDEQGIYAEGYLHLFKTFTDARNFLDNIYGGCGKKQYRIVGEWRCD